MKGQLGLLGLVVALSALASTAGAQGNIGEVRSCLPLADGGLWIGTAAGLVETDSNRRPVAYRGVSEGIPTGRIHALAALGGDRFVVAGEGGLVVVRRTQAQLRVLRSHRGLKVRAIAEGPKGLWIGTWGRGVFHLDWKTDRLTEIPFSGSVLTTAKRVTALTLDGAGHLYTATTGGLFRFDGGRMVAVSLAGASPHGKMIHALKATDGGLLIGTLAGTFRLVGGTDTPSLEAVDTADGRAFVIDGKNTLVATMGGGLAPLGTEGQVGPSEAAFVMHAAQAHGAICLVTPDGVWSKGKDWGPVALTGPLSADISAMAHDGPRLWVGTFDRGVGYFEGGRWHAVEGVDRRINAIAVEARGHRVWVGTARGLYVRQGGRWRSADAADGLPHAEVHSLAPLKRGGVLVGTTRCAAQASFADQRLRIEKICLKQGVGERSVWAVAEDARGGRYFGTTEGLFYQRNPRRRARRFSMLSGHLVEDWVTAISIQGQRVFVGTYSRGVNELRRGRRVWTSRHLGGGWVNPAGLHLHQGRLFASTMQGLFSIDVSTGQERADADSDAAWNRHRTGVGRDTTALVHHGDGLWVGSRRGFGRLL